MKSITLFFWAMLLCFSTLAQSNLLTPLGINNILITQFREQLNSHYFLTYKVNFDVKKYGGYPFEFTINKSDKNNHILLGSKVVMGDTVQADSAVNFSDVNLLVKNDKIHLFYKKGFILDTTRLPVYKRFATGLYYQQLDTNLNIIIPERKIKSTNGDDDRFLLANIQTVLDINDNVMVGNFYADTTDYFSIANCISQYIILNSAGVIIKEDSFGILPPVIPPHYTQRVVEVVHYGADKLLVSEQLFHPTVRLGFYIADTMLNIIDTFYQKPTRFFKPPDTDGFLNRSANMVAISDHSFILGGQYRHGFGSWQATHTVLMKQRLSTRFKTDLFTVIPGYDNNDLLNQSSPSIHSLAYNAFDNLLYYALSTHSNEYLLGCEGPDNYIQVVCADTNLQVKWRKFIYAGVNTCAIVGYVTKADQRGGCLVAGERYSSTQPGNTALYADFVYYIDSTGNLSVPEENGVEVRDRVALYPNPADSYIVVHDLFDKIDRIRIIDMNGRVVADNRNVTTSQTDVSGLPSGIYNVTVITKDNEVHNLKFVKN